MRDPVSGFGPRLPVANVFAHDIDRVFDSLGALLRVGGASSRGRSRARSRLFSLALAFPRPLPARHFLTLCRRKITVTIPVAEADSMLGNVVAAKTRTSRRRKAQRASTSTGTSTEHLSPTLGLIFLLGSLVGSCAFSIGSMARLYRGSRLPRHSIIVRSILPLKLEPPTHDQFDAIKKRQD